MSSSNQRFAVIDLGTNTFHLLITEALPAGGFSEVYRERKFTQLAEEGIETIGAAALQRGLKALQHFKQQLTAHQVEQVRAFGTAALRTASNGPDFIRQVAEEIGIDIQLISGTEEARLIHLGVLQAVEFTADRFLIMDIGGGSVEFIIADKQEVYWSQSFPIGVAVLFRAFHQEEPIPAEAVTKLTNYLKTTLAPLSGALAAHPAHVLVGASGTFDVLESILPEVARFSKYARVPLDGFPAFYQQMLGAGLSERLAIEGIPPARAEMLVVALVLIHVVIELAQVQELCVSAYAMKEGMLYEMMQS